MQVEAIQQTQLSSRAAKPVLVFGAVQPLQPARHRLPKFVAVLRLNKALSSVEQLREPARPAFAKNLDYLEGACAHLNLKIAAA
jgi:hypothetical protein